ncbi:MAG TPA: hypothetical protein VEQ40_10410 [Pyrinomonadaceae bacterium]|nr:hypothetical protein [Pyrinomonadaceae bacterium]
MQAITATLKQETTRRRIDWARLIEVSLSLVTRVFGCWHQEMSRPFTLSAKSYRVCLECGAHRRFNPQTWELTGPYFYAQASPSELYRGMNAAVKVTPARHGHKPVLRAA